jgi:taurine dioxygenase
MRLLRTTALGVEVVDLDARALTSREAAELRSAVYEHKLVVVRDQYLDANEYVALARKLGRLQVYFQKNYRHPEFEEIFVSSNMPENGKKIGVAGTGQYWHSDYQFFREPLSTTLVYPQVLPVDRRETYSSYSRFSRVTPLPLAVTVDFASGHRGQRPACLLPFSSDWHG